MTQNNRLNNGRGETSIVDLVPHVKCSVPVGVISTGFLHVKTSSHNDVL